MNQTKKQKRGINVGSQLLASILVNAVYAMINYPIMMLNSFLAPFSLLIVITFVSHGTLVGVAIIGGMMMSLISGGISLQGDLSHLKNDMKLQDMVISSETGPGIYILGMALSNLVYALPALAVLSALALIFIHTTLAGWLMIICAVSMMFLFSVSLGFLFANISSDVMQSWNFGALLSTLLSTLPPVYYPITYLPYPYRYLAYLSPTTYAAQIAQVGAGFLSVSLGNMYFDWAVMLVLSAIVLFVALKKNRWREA
jgi:ABC-2 type transport system permease protein